MIDKFNNHKTHFSQKDYKNTYFSWIIPVFFIILAKPVFHEDL